MTIYISEEDKICNIQQAFNDQFPYLKLEFYEQPHAWGAPCPSSCCLSPETPVGQIRMVHTFGWIDIGILRTAAEVEYDFRKILGLSVQIYQRKTGEWLKTTVTDDCTLAQLNAECLDTGRKAFTYRGLPVTGGVYTGGS